MPIATFLPSFPWRYGISFWRTLSFCAECTCVKIDTPVSCSLYRSRHLMNINLTVQRESPETNWISFEILSIWNSKTLKPKKNPKRLMKDCDQVSLLNYFNHLWDCCCISSSIKLRFGQILGKWAVLWSKQMGCLNFVISIHYSNWMQTIAAMYVSFRSHLLAHLIT